MLSGGRPTTGRGSLGTAEANASEFIGVFQEEGRHRGIEMTARSRRDMRKDIRFRPGFAVNPIIHKRVVDVGNCHPPTALGDRIPGQPLRISPAVPPLVVRQGDLPGQLQHRNGRTVQDFRTDGGMLLYMAALRVRQPARL